MPADLRTDERRAPSEARRPRHPVGERTNRRRRKDRDEAGAKQHRADRLALVRVARELGETMTDEELQEMVERADSNGDGAVSMDDFYNIMTKKTFT